jgi:hypothetical protein
MQARLTSYNFRTRMNTAKLVRATAAAATLGTLIAGAALFALPAAADVTGYQTGYNYTQGLANGDGSMLMATDMSQGSALVTASGDTSNTSTAVTSDTSAVPVTSTVLPAAVEPAANAAGLTVAMAVGWGALGLAVLLILAAIWSFFAQDAVTRTRREHSYQ